MEDTGVVFFHCRPGVGFLALLCQAVKLSFGTFCIWNIHQRAKHLVEQPQGLLLFRFDAMDLDLDDLEVAPSGGGGERASCDTIDERQTNSNETW